jgi:transposase
MLTTRIGERIRAVAPALLTMPGCGELTAAKILGEAANVTRFKSADAFAQYAGVAPIPYGSGQRVQLMRPLRPGNRQLNRALHIIAVTQIRWNQPGKAYYRKRIDAGDSPKQARRALKRRVAHAVFRRLQRDQGHQAHPPAAA